MKRHQDGMRYANWIGLVSIAVVLPAIAVFRATAQATNLVPPARISAAGQVQASPVLAQATLYDADMARALYSLLEAQSYLGSASSNEGGHRDAALTSTNDAIQATLNGIRYGFTDRNATLWGSSEFANPKAKVTPKASDPNYAKFQQALKALQSAKSALTAARADKGGWRVKAISYTDQAITRVQKAVWLANPDRDPNMVQALSELKNVEKTLLKATGDKGGHRAKALGLVRQAIQETQLGLEYDRKN